MERPTISAFIKSPGHGSSQLELWYESLLRTESHPGQAMPCHFWARLQISLCPFPSLLSSDLIDARVRESFPSSSEMKIVGHYITEETDVAMELCKKVQAEECVIHVEESTNLYTHLRFSLLASTWFPLRLGVCLWSALHMFLVLYEVLMLLVLFSTVFALAVLSDAILVAVTIQMVLIFPVLIIGLFLAGCIIVVLAWLWLVITCQCCTMPERALGQGLGQYLFTAGGTLLGQDPHPGLGRVNWADASNGLRAIPEAFATPKFVNHVILVSFPYRRVQLGGLCREIVPWCDTIVI